MQLEGKLAVITGAATGIGKATAKHFVRDGARVVIGDINEEAARATVAELGGDDKARFVRADVSRASDMEALMETAAEVLGGLDVIVNNAGIQRSGAVTEFPESEWDALMAVNPKSCFLAARYGVPHLRRRGGGAIVNTASIAGLKGGPGMTAYSASKGAIVAFSKALAAELAPDGIRVNSICPGWIDTPFNQPAIDFMGGRERQEKIVRASVPLGVQGTPDQIAPGIAFLASDAASYITGQALVVDGGLL
jgi:NAD(P)-dependent dehydrogenase (short-subunit alcohol dehydrogenase family)